MNRKKYKNTTFSRKDNNKKKSKVVDSVNIDYNKKNRKVFGSVNNNKITASHQQPKIENVNNNKNRTLIIRFSNCGEAYLMNYILFRKQEPIFIITKSVNQYPNIKAQTSDEMQPLHEYENSTVVFDDMLLTKQESNIDLFFTGGRHKILTFTRYLKVIFISQKILFVIILT